MIFKNPLFGPEKRSGEQGEFLKDSGYQKRTLLILV